MQKGLALTVLATYLFLAPLCFGAHAQTSHTMPHSHTHAASSKMPLAAITYHSNQYSAFTSALIVLTALLTLAIFWRLHAGYAPVLAVASFCRLPHPFVPTHPPNELRSRLALYTHAPPRR